MKKYRILVVDDEFKYGEENRAQTIINYLSNDWIRKNENLTNKNEILELLPTEFEVETCATMDSFKHIMEKKDIHAFLIDYMLYNTNKMHENGDFKEGDFKSVLHNIKEKYSSVPVYVYSSKWDESTLANVLTDFNEVFSNKVPNNLFTFKTFHQAMLDCKLNTIPLLTHQIEKVEKARKQIWDTIAKQRNHVTFQPSAPSGDIVILHISDLQFGDKNTTNNVAGLWNTIQVAIEEYLEKEGLRKIDLIVITGDIAMKGKTEEFRKAIKELTIFFKKIWSDDQQSIKDRVIVIPGNHDFDINTCVLNYFKAQNKEKERIIDFDSVMKQIERNKDESQSKEYQKIGLHAFREFAYELTQDSQYILSENLDFIIEKFNNWGLRFICLNSVYKIEAQKTNRADIDNNSICKMCNESNAKEDYLTIILTHHTPLSKDSLSKEENDSISNAIRGLKRGVNAQIVFGGHRHKNETKKENNSAKKTINIVEAASLRVEDESDEYLRGFGVFRINSDLNGGKLQYFIFDKDDGEVQESYSQSYTFT